MSKQVMPSCFCTYTPVLQDAQVSSDQLTALQQQLTASQTDLAAAQQTHQQLSQKSALASTESQTMEDSCGDSLDLHVQTHWLHG